MNFTQRLYNYYTMDKVQDIVYKLYNKECTQDCHEYKLIECLREPCNGSQGMKKFLKSLIENLMCLAVLKGKDNIHVYNIYKKLCHNLIVIYGDVGLPSDIKDLFNFGRANTSSINNIMNQLNSWPNPNFIGYIPYSWKLCKLSKLKGVGKKSVMNITGISLINLI